ncbi:MAG: sulfatase [Halioglobus sp.]
MTIISVLKRVIGSIFITGAVLLLVIFFVVAYRAMTYQQVDSQARLQNKYEYLEGIANSAQNPDRPNIIFVLYDDMGYGDIGAGAVNNTQVSTPNIDQLASSGIMLSNFYSPAPVCTPSRAGFLTGRLPPRAGIPYVVFPSGSVSQMVNSTVTRPTENIRLPAEEITIANILSAAGYATKMVGKWHLGDRSPSLPNDMGFDQYYGALYSNDMQPFAFYRNKNIEVQAPVDQTRMTALYTSEAVEFITDNAGASFFLYFAHNFPHDPLSASEERSGKSDAGLYGDVLEEIDDSIGAIVSALEKTNTLDNTLIIISSDNGPWFLGNAGHQRGRKGNTFEGGMRVPFIAHWPAKIPAGNIVSSMAMGTDLLPTLLELLRLPAPTDRILDGKSIAEVLTQAAPSPHQYLYYFDGNTLFATRDSSFKYRRSAAVHYGTDEMPFYFPIPQKEWLFDLRNNNAESYDVSGRYPQVLTELKAALQKKEKELEDNLRGWL